MDLNRTHILFQVSSTTGTDDKKLTEELRRLQAEINSLRSENTNLKVCIEKKIQFKLLFACLLFKYLLYAQIDFLFLHFKK